MKSRNLNNQSRIKRLYQSNIGTKTKSKVLEAELKTMKHALKVVRISAHKENGTDE